MTRRLLVSYLLITALVLVVLEVPLGLFFQQRQLERLTADTERDATVLITAYEDDLEADAPLDPLQAQVYAERTGVRVVVVDQQGSALIDTGNETGRDFSTRPEFITALRGERATGTRRSDTLDIELLYVAVPVASGGIVHGALRLTLDTHESSAQIRRFWWGLAGIAVLVLLMVAAVGWATARSISRPILRLQATAMRFSSGDLSPADPVSGAPPEIEQLDAAMSTMASQLDRLLRQQRSFVADASHQLRTPLTALRLRLENLQATTSDAVPSGDTAFDSTAFDSTALGDTALGDTALGDTALGDTALGDTAFEETAVENIEAAIAETDRLAALVGDLLALATAERPSAPIPTALSDIVIERVTTWTAFAEQSGVTLAFVGTLPSTAGERVPDVLAVSGAVEQMVDNLVENAVRALDDAAPDDAPRIAVGLSVDRQRVTLTVADNGPGLDPEQREHAVERFWRGDHHGAANAGQGSGLGLSIVKGLADASGATLSLSSNDDGGLTVAIAFQRAVDGPQRRRT